MNQKISIGLIVGFIFSFIAAITTSSNKYFGLEYGDRYEINIDEYNSSKNRNQYIKETNYNSTLILISLIGGIGVGYLIGDYIEKIKNKNLQS